ncbi:MAG: hypothetical protein JWM99_4606 [Verrucomicrobiales bacterium]|nr:hypothetical protein [Verrucomicrobiales bacterium]
MQMIFSKSVGARRLHRGNPIQLWSRCNRIYMQPPKVIEAWIEMVEKMNIPRRYYVCPSGMPQSVRRMLRSLLQRSRIYASVGK